MTAKTPAHQISARRPGSAMTTPDLYARLTAGALAHLYFEMQGTPEAAVIYDAGLINCGKTDFDALIAEYEAEAAL